MKKTFFIKSTDGVNNLHGKKWVPEGEIKAAVQIVHGMQEYIGRYNDFAEFLASNGFVVYGIDHLGHGGSAASLDDLGYFASRGGKAYLLKDQHKLTKLIKKENPGIKVFMVGHSMGSFVLRRYITIWGGELSGAVVIGTGTKEPQTTKLALFVSYMMRLFFGARHRSKLLYYMANGAYMLEFKLKRKGSWLTKNVDVAEAYGKDPACNYVFTVSAYHTLFSLLDDIAREKNNDRIPKDLPILFASGMDDPVGEKTRGVLKAYNECVRRGQEDVDIIFYENDRHEILNELDRDDVYDDILSFLECRV